MFSNKTFTQLRNLSKVKLMLDFQINSDITFRKHRQYFNWKIVRRVQKFIVITF
ncbi:hypothetical protein X975_21622, partial [Stegodyphus mimosarum]